MTTRIFIETNSKETLQNPFVSFEVHSGDEKSDEEYSASEYGLRGSEPSRLDALLDSDNICLRLGNGLKRIIIHWKNWVRNIFFEGSNH